MEEKTLDQIQSDIYWGISDMLDTWWWIVKQYADHVIINFNGDYFDIPFTYENDGDVDRVVFPEKSEWKSVQQVWVAKQMMPDRDKIMENIKKENTATTKEVVIDNNVDSENAIEIEVNFLAKSQSQHLVYSVVYEPDTVDSQNDWATEQEIEKMCHTYLKNHLLSNTPAVDLQHKEDLPLEKAIPVESYIAPTDFKINDTLIKKGSWVLVTHVPDDNLWEQIEKGIITGYSLKGSGLRIPDDMVTQ